MAIFGIVGGIASGKTLAMVYLLYSDAVIFDKEIQSNIPLKSIPRAKLLDNELAGLLGKDLSNTSLGLDEIHNVLDSRSSSNKKNKKRTHFILQSRHSGKGSLDIYYTTQFKGQVDLRLRSNTDVWVYPCIIKRDKDDRPLILMLTFQFKNGQSITNQNKLVDIEPFLDMYDTHGIVDMDI